MDQTKNENSFSVVTFFFDHLCGDGSGDCAGCDTDMSLLLTLTSDKSMEM
jgi:hypothetical protein